MESQEESKYQVIITDPAEISFYEILEFLFDHYTLERAEELANTLRDTISSLNYQPKRGALEHRLIGRINEYRFILFKRRWMTIKYPSETNSLPCKFAIHQC